MGIVVSIYFSHDTAKQAQCTSMREVPKRHLTLASKCYNQKRKFNTLCDFFSPDK